MTAPAVEQKIEFHARYKAPHELAGMHVQRGRECGCGRWFPQWVVSRRWLESIGGDRAEAFKRDACEVETYSKGDAAWHPKRCHRCERRALETAAALAR